MIWNMSAVYTQGRVSVPRGLCLGLPDPTCTSHLQRQYQGAAGSWGLPGAGTWLGPPQPRSRTVMGTGRAAQDHIEPLGQGLVALGWAGMGLWAHVGCVGWSPWIERYKSHTLKSSQIWRGGGEGSSGSEQHLCSQCKQQSGHCW